MNQTNLGDYNNSVIEYKKAVTSRNETYSKVCALEMQLREAQEAHKTAEYMVTDAKAQVEYNAKRLGIEVFNTEV